MLPKFRVLTTVGKKLVTEAEETMHRIMSIYKGRQVSADEVCGDGTDGLPECRS